MTPEAERLLDLFRDGTRMSEVDRRYLVRAALAAERAVTLEKVRDAFTTPAGYPRTLDQVETLIRRMK
jgi:hypothetical protein